MVSANVCKLVTDEQLSTGGGAKVAADYPLKRLSRRDKRITSFADFARVIAARQRQFSHYVRIDMDQGQAAQARIGLVVARKNTRTAIQRNLIRRCIVEQFNLHHNFLPNLDIVVTLRKSCTKPNQARQAAQDFSRLLTNILATK